jgi:hypothetical protein
MKLAILSLAILATGCASNMYYADGAGQEMPRQVLLECEYEATKATAGITNAAQAGWMMGDITRRCFELRGYTMKRRPA